MGVCGVSGTCWDECFTLLCCTLNARTVCSRKQCNVCSVCGVRGDERGQWQESSNQSQCAALGVNVCTSNQSQCVALRGCVSAGKRREKEGEREREKGMNTYAAAYVCCVCVTAVCVVTLGMQASPEAYDADRSRLQFGVALVSGVCRRWAECHGHVVCRRWVAASGRRQLPVCQGSTRRVGAAARGGKAARR